MSRIGSGLLAARGRGTISRRKAREMAEELFERARLTMRPAQLCTLPPPLQAELDERPAARAQVAATIAKAPTLMQRQAIWILVPRKWRDEVAECLGLLLGGVYGTRGPEPVMLAEIAREVPADFRPEVEFQARRVLELRKRTDNKPL